MLRSKPFIPTNQLVAPLATTSISSSASHAPSVTMAKVGQEDERRCSDSPASVVSWTGATSPCSIRSDAASMTDSVLDSSSQRSSASVSPCLHYLAMQSVLSGNAKTRGQSMSFSAVIADSSDEDASSDAEEIDQETIDRRAQEYRHFRKSSARARAVYEGRRHSGRSGEHEHRRRHSDRGKSSSSSSQGKQPWHRKLFGGSSMDSPDDAATHVPKCNKKLVKMCMKHWNAVAKASPKWCIRVFGVLFELEPRTKDIFRLSATDEQAILLHGNNIKGQFDSLAQTPNEYKKMAQKLFDLGRWHSVFKMQPEFFDVFGKALIVAFARLTTPKWSPKIEKAYEHAFSLVIQPLKDGLELGLKERDQRRRQKDEHAACTPATTERVRPLGSTSSFESCSSSAVQSNQSSRRQSADYLSVPTGTGGPLSASPLSPLSQSSSPIVRTAPSCPSQRFFGIDFTPKEDSPGLAPRSARLSTGSSSATLQCPMDPLTKSMPDHDALCRLDVSHTTNLLSSKAPSLCGSHSSSHVGSRRASVQHPHSTLGSGFGLASDCVTTSKDDGRLPMPIPMMQVKTSLNQLGYTKLHTPKDVICVPPMLKDAQRKAPLDKRIQLQMPPISCRSSKQDSPTASIASGATSSSPSQL
eukprot:m.294415 g.294415  ORF g.294415 m.294415 type:complete len:640 (-) comp15849_c1_seq6:2932-4851(-)